MKQFSRKQREQTEQQQNDRPLSFINSRDCSSLLSPPQTTNMAASPRQTQTSLLPLILSQSDPIVLNLLGFIASVEPEGGWNAVTNSLWISWSPSGVQLHASAPS